MLNTVKSTTLKGQSKVTVNGSEIVVVSLHADINESGTSNVVTTIVNKDLYEENKGVCREDIDAFISEVRLLEDADM